MNEGSLLLFIEILASRRQLTALYSAEARDLVTVVSFHVSRNLVGRQRSEVVFLQQVVRGVMRAPALECQKSKRKKQGEEGRPTRSTETE